MNFKVSSRETFYLNLMRFISFLIYISLFCFTGPFLIIPICISFIGSVSLLGSLRGNAVCISEKQFPDIFKILVEQSQALGLKKVPKMYVVQKDGILNAFATRLFKRDHVVLFADIFELAYKDGREAVSFIIAHELGHIKQNHVGFWKNVSIFPARLVPFLSTAYSRACEYTCDNIGYSLSPKGAKNGLLILCAGKRLYKKVNVTEMLLSFEEEKGWATWWVEINSTHPLMIKRIKALNFTEPTISNQDKLFVSPTLKVDHQQKEL